MTVKITKKDFTDQDLRALYRELRKVKDETGTKKLNPLYNKLMRTDKFPSAFQHKIEKYPELDFEMSYEEISKYFDQNNGINSHFNIELKANGLAKLLYAVLWKNGDLQKIKHIVNGMQGCKISSSSAIVFYQFGKHLVNRHEPIVDQHTIRAKLLFDKRFGEPEEEAEEVVIKKIRKKETISQSEVTEYNEWIKAILGNELDADMLSKLDKIMFMLGKAAKKK